MYDEIVALCVDFNNQAVWGAKVYMDNEQAIIQTKDGDLISATWFDVLDELTL